MRAPVPPSVARLSLVIALAATAACADQPLAAPDASAPVQLAGPRFNATATSRVLNPANGHYYELVAVTAGGGSRWHEANVAATLRGGYLATITSQAEQDFVVGLARGRYLGIYWLGGLQETGAAEPAGGWRWRTTESWGYANWNSGEPNNSGGAEDNLSLYLFAAGHPDNGKWNDRHTWSRIQGYVVEYEDDASAPVLTPSIQGTAGENGWYVSDVTVTWSIEDAQTPTVVLSGCQGGAVTADTESAGFACEAASGGGTASAATQVKRDATAPTLAFSGNLGAYTVDQTVAITCAASDATPGSGLASSDCAGVSGPAYQFGVGPHSFSASATDRAGNHGTAAGQYQVIVSTGSLCTLVERFSANRGVANALCQKLDAVAAAEARGNQNAKQGALGAFVNQVQAQSGKAFTAAQAATLVQLAGAL